MRIYAGIGAAIGWFALVLQLVLILTADSEISVGLRAFNFFSYFTILSNILVAVTLTFVALGGRGAVGRFFSRPSVQTGVALYVGVTGIVYSLILRAIWAPEGWQKLADQLLHDAMPLIYVAFWLIFVRKGTLSFANVPWFVAFPVVYAAYTLIRGPMVDWYPYPFIDASVLSTSELIVNVIVLCVAFLVLGALLVLADRWLGRRFARA